VLCRLSDQRRDEAVCPSKGLFGQRPADGCRSEPVSTFGRIALALTGRSYIRVESSQRTCGYERIWRSSPHYRFWCASCNRWFRSPSKSTRGPAALLAPWCSSASGARRSPRSYSRSSTNSGGAPTSAPSARRKAGADRAQSCCSTTNSRSQFWDAAGTAPSAGAHRAAATGATRRSELAAAGSSGARSIHPLPRASIPSQ
jgi:hypothetical protein